MPADEAALFANLLAQAGAANEDDVKSTPDTEKALQTHAAGKSKKTKDDAGDTVVQFAELQAIPAHLTVLNAKFASTNGEMATSKHGEAEKKPNPIGATDAVKDTEDTKNILNRILDAETIEPAGKSKQAKTGKNADTETGVTTDTKAVVPDAASAVAVPAATEPEKATAETSQKYSGAIGNVQTANAAKVAIAAPDETAQANVKTGADTQVKSTDAKVKDAKADDVKPDATKDTASQTADKAAALTAAADKTVRQNVASQGSQARVLPVHLEAQVAVSQSGNNAKTGSDSNPAHTPAQHGKNDTDAKLHEDAVQPAAKAPLNSAGAVQPAAHTQTQATNAQPTIAQAPTQASSPAVAASLQVAPQTAQLAAQPNVATLAVQIAAKSGDGNKLFDIRLDPPELGRVEVKLTFDDKGHAQAHLAVEKPQTLDMLQNDRGNLERALRDSGINLSQSGLNFSLKGQERQGDNAPSFRGRSRSLAVTAAIESTSAAAAASTHSFAAGDARLDIRV